MRAIRLIASAHLSLVLIAATPPASGQDLSCDDVEFEASAVEEFPSVAQSCHSIVERNGRLYVRLVADVVRAVSDREILVDLKGPDGSRIRQTYRPPPGFRAVISGNPTPAHLLRRGQEIRLYLPADRWHVSRARDSD